MKVRLLAGATILLAFLLPGCSSSGVHASRERLYSTLGELSSVSSAVVLGDVVDQQVIPGSPAETTVSIVRVIRTFDPPQLGEESREGLSEIHAGAEVRVRQIGSRDMAAVPAPILERGETYLIFLAASGLEGAAASDFFISGGQPGYFRIDGDEFVRVVAESEDTLPVRITEEDLAR
jgi:hypothetical protein